MSISAALRIMRPKHYIKNFFIFLPLFFDLKISDYESFYITFLSFISFSLTASSVYIFNDYFDIEEDVNCATDLDNFSKMAPMEHVYFEGDLELEKYTRYMKIGYK